MSAWPELLERARPFLEAGVLTHADVLPIALVARRFQLTDPDVGLGLAFAVRAPRVGHPAVELERIAARVEAERELRRTSRAASSTPSSTPGLTLEGSDGALEGDDVDATDADTIELPWPEANAWAAKVRGFRAAVGAPTDVHLPFVAQTIAHRGNGATTTRGLLLTRRMYREQERVAAALRARATTSLPESAMVHDLDRALLLHFPDGEHPLRAARAEARHAARIAATSPLAVVIGGPGTGKTFSVTRLLATLLSGSAGAGSGRELKIALAAPTGKAATRMRDAIREATERTGDAALHVDDAVRARLRELRAETLHKLVGVRPDGSCRHHTTNPLDAQVVVVDEVSMVDLTTMRRLLEAVSPEARLVLLGDRDQLASVDAGCVLADLVDGAAGGVLASCVARFTQSQRFAGAPDVGLVAAGLQSYRTAHRDLAALETTSERCDVAIAVMTDERHATDERVGRDEEGSFPRARAHARIAHLDEPEVNERGFARPRNDQLDALARPYVDGFTLYASPPVGATFEPAPPASGLPEPSCFLVGYARLLRELRRGRGWDASLSTAPVQRRVLEAFERYRVLAVHREGPLGVSGLERALAARVRRAIHGDAGGSGRYWVGRPVLVTENAYDVGLMNGDVGVILPVRRADGSSALAAVFADEGADGVRAVATSRLPPHEGALVMTVHKSQGSQFERVALVLAGRPSPIQTRELVYTGVTRAKDQLAWLGTRAELRDALGLEVARVSGLAGLLR